MKDIETKIKQILKSDANVDLSFNDIATFVEGNLDAEQAKELAVRIAGNPRLAKIVEEVRYFEQSRFSENVPSALHHKLLDRLGLDETFFDAILKKFDHGFKILQGQLEKAEPALAVRGTAATRFSLEKNLAGIDIQCKIELDDDEVWLQFKARKDKIGVRNLRFSVKCNDENCGEEVSNDTGNSGTIPAKMGDIEVQVSHGNEPLGQLRLQISE